VLGKEREKGNKVSQNGVEWETGVRGGGGMGPRDVTGE
jgi:hypothetical protein